MATASPACPLCGSSDQDFLFAKGDWPIHRCTGCGHVFSPAVLPSHVESVYGSDYFTGGGAGYADYLSEGPIVRRRARRYARILSRYMHPGRVLDVGAAAGFFLQGLKDAGWNGCGIEPNPEMAQYGRTVLGLELEAGTLEALATDERFDLITMIQVVPHFVDPRAALDAAKAVTAEGGYWLIETWNCESLTARLFGRYWHEYSPPSVLHWFTPKRLTRLVESLGLQEVARGRLSKQLSGGHAKSLMQHVLGDTVLSRTLRPIARLLPDDATLPYPAEDLFWALYRKPATGGETT